jgi:hypothetical protein
VEWGQESEAARGKVMVAVQPWQVSEAMCGTNGLLDGLLAGQLHVPGDWSVPGTY